MTAARRTRLPSESESALSHGASMKAPEAFRTIGEASEELDLKPHVLRFWETRFTALKPMKRADGRRYYRPEDMALLRTLKHLLHDKGLTIRGALKVLQEQGHDVTADSELTDASEEALAEAVSDATGASVRELQQAVQDAVARGDFLEAAVSGQAETRDRLEALLADLCDLKSRLDTVRLAN